MSLPTTLKAPSDRTLNRLIVGVVVALLIGIPAIAVIYVTDRYVAPGSALPDRNVAKYEDAVRRNPNLVSARLALAGFYSEANRWSDAVAQYGEVLKLDKANTFALLGRADAYRQLADPTAAGNDYEAVIASSKGADMANVNPQLERAYYQLGSLQLAQGRTQDAIASLVAALGINRADADAMNLLGAAYIKAGEPGKAVFVLHEAVRFVPTNWCDPYRQMVQAFTALDEPDGVRYASAMATYCAGDAERAKKGLEPLLAGQFATESLLGLGMIAEGRGDWAAARDDYTKVLAKDPQDFNAGQGLQRASAAINGAAQPSSPARQAPSAPPGGNS